MARARPAVQRSTPQGAAQASGAVGQWVDPLGRAETTRDSRSEIRSRNLLLLLLLLECRSGPPGGGSLTLRSARHSNTSSPGRPMSRSFYVAAVAGRIQWRLRVDGPTEIPLAHPAGWSLLTPLHPSLAGVAMTSIEALGRLGDRVWMWSRSLCISGPDESDPPDNTPQDF